MLKEILVICKWESRYLNEFSTFKAFIFLRPMLLLEALTPSYCFSWLILKPFSLTQMHNLSSACCKSCLFLALITISAVTILNSKGLNRSPWSTHQFALSHLRCLCYYLSALLNTNVSDTDDQQIIHLLGQYLSVQYVKNLLI